MITNQFKSAEDDAEDDACLRDLAKNRAEENVITDIRWIQLALNSEYGEIGRVAGIITKMFKNSATQDDLRNEFIHLLAHPIEAAAIKMLEKGEIDG